MVCVPLYMLLSGYLSAEKHIPLTRSGLLGYYKKLLPIFLTYALSTGVILLYRVLWLGEEQTIRSAVKNLLSFQQYSWYMNMYFGLLLLTPFLNALWQSLATPAARRALLDLEGAPAKTAVCVLADKEEIGSDGVTGMQSAAFDTFMEDLCESQGVPVRVCFEKSFCLSADVTAAYDPNFSDVYEKRNAAYLNYGIGLCKYTGSRGKSGASDASAELVAYVRRVLDGAGVVWQMAELGKADQGGGGTVAVFMAERNIDTLDAGVPVLSMHSPFETVSKLDCYETYKGMKAVFQAEK